MNLRKPFIIFLLLCLAIPAVKADKGMWILKELKQENKDRMRELGFLMDFDKLYSEQGPSLHKAVVIFGRGCTGITVSPDGLVFTNHHCGYSSIQSQSTVEHDYLKDGFVSHNRTEELPIPGLSVRYLSEMVDVTERINAAAKSFSNELDRINAIQKEIKAIEAEYNKDKKSAARVYPFYNDNVFYLIRYDVFTDVRMVFAPPSGLGKFGGDTDNWMWPRHTDDFSVFRVYANKDNEPADYSKDNVPYHPVSFAKVSLQGVWDYDFAMTIGFPGSTDRYLSSWGVQSLIENQNKPRIEVRGLKQEVWKRFMSKDPAIRIQYASKYAGSANYWKNSIGMNKGLKRLNVIGDKQALEKSFREWVASSPERVSSYGFVLDSLRQGIEETAQVQRNVTYLYEALSGMELPLMAADPNSLDAAAIEKIYKDYSPTVAAATIPVMLQIVRERVDAAYLPDIYKTIEEKYKGKIEDYTAMLFRDSKYATAASLTKALNNKAFLEGAYKEDPAYLLRESFMKTIRESMAKTTEMRYKQHKGERLFFAGLREMDPQKALPSDANFTMRLSYGKVSGYTPYDAAWYSYYTTHKGLLEKYDAEVDEFNLNADVLSLVRNKDFGRYADPDGNLRLCFLSDNDITGGNSGSPVFDKNGYLIGLAFDGNWEAMSGDIEFEPNMQRTISVDIRYVLWTIEKWGKATHLISELELVQ